VITLAEWDAMKEEAAKEEKEESIETTKEEEEEISLATGRIFDGWPSTRIHHQHPSDPPLTRSPVHLNPIHPSLADEVGDKRVKRVNQS